MEQFTGSCSRCQYSLKQFETRLDKCWENHDVTFDWTVTGTGHRSECKLETVLESYI